MDILPDDSFLLKPGKYENIGVEFENWQMFCPLLKCILCTLNNEICIEFEQKSSKDYKKKKKNVCTWTWYRNFIL